jgi:hypothetical protein
MSLVNHDAEASRSWLSNPDQQICWLARWCLAPVSVRLSQNGNEAAGGPRYRWPLELSSGGSKFP